MVIENGETTMARRLRKGQAVRFQFGIRRVEGVVTEDRGPIGVKGRRLYGVEFLVERGADSPSYTELPAENLELVAPVAVAAATSRKSPRVRSVAS